MGFLVMVRVAKNPQKRKLRRYLRLADCVTLARTIIT